MAQTLTEGDRVAAYCHVVARHAGELFGVPPSDRPVDFWGVTAGKRIRRHDAYRDPQRDLFARRGCVGSALRGRPPSLPFSRGARLRRAPMRAHESRGADDVDLRPC